MARKKRGDIMTLKLAKSLEPGKGDKWTNVDWDSEVIRV